jgi:molecular chaperone HtpG
MKRDWRENENVNQLSIDINRPNKGFVGSIIIGLLEMHNMPVSTVHVTSNSVNINGENYDLEKKITMSTNEIELVSTSITIDDDGNIEKSELTSMIAESKSRVSLHGIEIATSLFPRSWETQTGQAKLSWPFPIVIVIDVCGNRDLDLNSSRAQVLHDEKWTNLEEELAFEVCSQIKENVEGVYWEELLPIIKESENQVFLSGLARVQ